MPTLTHYLTLSAAMFAIGLFGALTRRNAISILMCIEIMLNAVNINLVAFSRFLSDPATGLYLAAWLGDPKTPWSGGPLGQAFVVFTITVAAAEASVALAIVLAIFRSRKTIQIDDFNLMKW